MYDIIRSNGMFAALYPISLVSDSYARHVHHFMANSSLLCAFWLSRQIVFGNFIMMNLFLALLLDKFSSGGDDQANTKEMDMKMLARKMSSMKVAPLALPARKTISRTAVSSTSRVLRFTNRFNLYRLLVVARTVIGNLRLWMIQLVEWRTPVRALQYRQRRT